MKAWGSTLSKVKSSGSPSLNTEQCMSLVLLVSLKEISSFRINKQNFIEMVSCGKVA